MKRLGRILLSTVMMASLVVVPVFATPSVSELESEKAKAQREAESLQAELADLLDKMGQLEEELIHTGEEIIKATEELTEAEIVEREQYEAMKLRIKYMYENGNTSEMESLISSESFSELVNKAEYVSEVHAYDRQKLKEYVEIKEKIKDLKETLEEKQDSLEEKQAAYHEKEEELSTTLESKRAEIADFDAQIQAAAEAAAAEALERENANRQEESNDNSSESVKPSKPSKPSNIGSSKGDTAVAQKIIDAAYSQLGVPYVYGGSTPGSAFDCSGLVQYCHRQAGISLPRTSQSQGGCGAAVSDPKPGDIVCYGSHVGIYIGGGQMIHAPKPGDVVKVAAVYGSPWYRRCW